MVKHEPESVKQEEHNDDNDYDGDDYSDKEWEKTRSTAMKGNGQEKMTLTICAKQIRVQIQELPC